MGCTGSRFCCGVSKKRQQRDIEDVDTAFPTTTAAIADITDVERFGASSSSRSDPKQQQQQQPGAKDKFSELSVDTTRNSGRTAASATPTEMPTTTSSSGGLDPMHTDSAKQSLSSSNGSSAVEQQQQDVPAAITLSRRQRKSPLVAREVAALRIQRVWRGVRARLKQQNMLLFHAYRQLRARDQHDARKSYLQVAKVRTVFAKLRAQRPGAHHSQSNHTLNSTGVAGLSDMGSVVVKAGITLPAEENINSRKLPRAPRRSRAAQRLAQHSHSNATLKSFLFAGFSDAGAAAATTGFPVAAALTLPEAESNSRRRLRTPAKFLARVMEELSAGNIVPQRTVLAILNRVHSVLIQEGNILDIQLKQVDVAKDGRNKDGDSSVVPHAVVVGTLRGQLHDLLAILGVHGLPCSSSGRHFVFAGGFVGAGTRAFECLLLLFVLKLHDPDAVHLLRGASENLDMATVDGQSLEEACLARYNLLTFEALMHTVAALPIAAILKESIFVVHGGLSRHEFTVDTLADTESDHVVKRDVALPPRASLLEDILWSDPREAKGKHSSARGAGVEFGADVTSEFLIANDMALMIRAGDVCIDGHEFWHDAQVLNVWSASDVGGCDDHDGGPCSSRGGSSPCEHCSNPAKVGLGNCGSVVTISGYENSQPRIQPFRGRPLGGHALPSFRLADIRARRACMVLRALLKRLAICRVPLVRHFDGIAAGGRVQAHAERRGAVNARISVPAWAHGLASVTEMKVPFIMLLRRVQMLRSALLIDSTIPTRAKVLTTDYRHLLGRVRPVLRGLAAVGGSDTSSAKADAEIAEFLFVRRSELRAVLRRIEYTKDPLKRGWVLAADFQLAVKALLSVLFDGRTWGEVTIRRITEVAVNVSADRKSPSAVDTKRLVSYERFFSAFYYVGFAEQGRSTGGLTPSPRRAPPV